ncbi:MAG: Ig-like domain-containing protein [Planctomycetota bacterium]
MPTARLAVAVPIFVLGAAHAFAQSSVVSDDFNAPTLDPVWRFVDPFGDCSAGLQGFGTSDAQLRIDVPGPQSHDLWFTENAAPRILQSAGDTDLLLEVKFDSTPEQRFQFQGIIVQETVDRFLRFEVLHDGTSARIFAAEVEAPVFARARANVAVTDAPRWIRVERAGDVWTMRTSVDGTTFTEAVSFTYALTVTEVGIHAGNFNAAGAFTAPEFVALADYFQNGELPILQEDGPVDTEPPIADAGPSISAHVGDVVQLDGTSSADDMTAPQDLAFAWNLAQSPPGSAAVLAGADTATPSFELDAVGDYVAELVVTDLAGLASAPVQVTISSLNQPPVADAGGDAVVLLGGPVLLDGFGSTDPDDDALQYEWTLLSAPAGSTAALAGASTAAPSLTPDIEGDYLVQLVVSDSFAFSEPANVTVSALGAVDIAIVEIHAASCTVRQSSRSSFRRWFYRPILDWQLRVAAWELRYGYDCTARARLQFILSRLDGCPERGAVDGWSWSSGYRVDWITDCSLQHVVYDLVTNALDVID